MAFHPFGLHSHQRESYQHLRDEREVTETLVMVADSPTFGRGPLHVAGDSTAVLGERAHHRILCGSRRAQAL